MFLREGLLLPSLTGERWVGSLQTRQRNVRAAGRTWKPSVRQALERRVYKHLDVFWRAV